MLFVVASCYAFNGKDWWLSMIYEKNLTSFTETDMEGFFFHEGGGVCLWKYLICLVMEMEELHFITLIK